MSENPQKLLELHPLEDIPGCDVAIQMSAQYLTTNFRAVEALGDELATAYRNRADREWAKLTEHYSSCEKCNEV